MEMVTIPKKEYERLKKKAHERTDEEIIEGVRQSLEDLKAGRVRRVA